MSQAAAPDTGTPSRPKAARTPARGKGAGARGRKDAADAPPKAGEASGDSLIDLIMATDYARNAATRARRRMVDKVTLGLCGMLALSLGANVYMGIQPTEYRYFAADSVGRIVPVTPLDQPVQSTAEVLDWFRIAVVESFTMSFTDQEVRLRGNRRFYTDDGWESFTQALRRAAFLETIVDMKLVSSVVPTGAPVIQESNVLSGGRYGWRIEMPILVNFESASGKRSQNFAVTAVVVRVPELESPRGLGIAQIIAR